MLAALLVWILATPASAGEGAGHITVGRSQDSVTQPAPVASGDTTSEAEYNQKFELNDVLSIRFHPWARTSADPYAWSSQSTFDPREISISETADNAALKVGYFTLKWEGTDGLNPMDIASMKDWGDPLNTPTKASAGIQFSKSFEHFDFEISYIPWNTPSSLPGTNSQWLPRKDNLPLRSSTVQLNFPKDEEIGYSYDSRQTLNDAFHNNVAVRLQAHGDLGDAALEYFEGASDTPILKPNIFAEFASTGPNGTVITLSPPVRLIVYDYRRRTEALLLTKTLGQWILRLAMRYEDSVGDSNLLPSWSQQTVAGIERSFDISGNTVTAVVQGAWNHHPDAGLLAVQDVFDQALLLGLRWPVGEKITVMASGFRSFKEGSEFNQLQGSYRWNDHWSTDLYAQVLKGSSSSLLNIFADNSRVGLNMTYAF